MSFATRLAESQKHEAGLAEYLTNQGLYVEPFGQALFTDEARARLRDCAVKQLIRWIPDLLVIGQAGVALVDVKGLPHARTGRHSVEDSATEAAELWEQVMGCSVYYGFPHDDGRWSFVSQNQWNANKTPGRFNGRGSGTPFHIAKCSDTCANQVSPWK